MTQKKKQISVRKQKIKKNHVREKRIFFTILAMVLLVVAAFARKLCPYDPDVQDLLLAQKPPSAEHILGTDRYGRDMFSRVLVGSTTSIYATLLLVAIITVLGTVRSVSCVPKPCFCPRSSWCTWRWHPECNHSTGRHRMAEVCQTCQRTDSCTERFTISDGGETFGKQHTENYV